MRASSDSRSETALSVFLRDYWMVFVLALLCVLCSWATYSEQHPGGSSGGQQAAREALSEFPKGTRVLIVARDSTEDRAFAEALRDGLQKGGMVVVRTVLGQPTDARQAIEAISSAGARLDLIACNHVTAAWPLLGDLTSKFPQLGVARILKPRSYRWPNFLKTDNLLNVANQIAVIAIIAIGMTMVVIAGGIDLSVGSLIALSAVVATVLMRDLGGGERTSAAGMALCCAGGVAVCGLVGAFSACMVTLFAIPAFIATLAMMLVASGLAFIIAEGQSIYQVPEAFTWLGRGATLGIPNAVWAMGMLYVAAHVLMTYTVLGRYIYAVGGNREAARLSGVPVRKVLLVVYTLCGLLAGAGGIVMASQLKSGAPTYGQMYELYVIAAVVVGGASLAGGDGRVFCTLIGALIIAVIQNGMNLTGVESYTQKIVLGSVILAAVLLDMLKRSGWRRLLRGLGPA